MSKRELLGGKLASIACGAVFCISASLPQVALAKPAVEQVEVELRPEAKGEPIVVAFKGWWAGRVDEGIDIKSDNAFRFARVVRKIVEANRSGKVSRILDVWQEKSHERIKRLYSNEKALERNKKFYENIMSSSLMGVARYGKYWLCVVKHDVRGKGPELKVYPLVSEGGNLVSTNELSRDFVFRRMLMRVGQRSWGIGSNGL